MSGRAEKLSVGFLLNEDSEQSRRDDRPRKVRSSPPSASSSSPPSQENTKTAKNDFSSRSFNHSRSVNPRAVPSRDLAGPSSAHAVQVSDPERMFRCRECYKTFVERGNLNKHISSVHRKEKNKVCQEPGCGKSFSFRDGLVRHIAHVHQNERRHACLLCDKAFKQASHLGKHMRSIHKYP